MSYRTLNTFTIKPTWPSAWGTSNAKLIVVLDRDVVSEDGVQYQGAHNFGEGVSLDSIGHYFSSTITVTDGVGSAAPIANLPTTDTSQPLHTAHYYAFIYVGNEWRDTLTLQGYHLHESVNGESSTFTWQQWVTAQAFKQGSTQLPMIGDRATFQAMLDAALLAAGTAKAYTEPSPLGRVSMTVAPADALLPKAVGDNDPRVPTQAENDALQGTNGAPSNANRYVTDSDTRLFRGIGVFNVLDYGAEGDGATDDTAAINAAIAALDSRGRGELQFPGNDYNVTAALTTITADGEAVGTGRAQTKTPPTNWGTRVKITSPTANLFTVSGARFTFSHMHLHNTAGSTPTAGAAIKATHASDAYAKVDYQSVSMYRFYDGLDVEVGNDWLAFNTAILSSVRYGAHIRNNVIPDTGGWTFIKCAIVSSTFAGIGVFAESCGGAHMIATNILGMAQAVKVTGVTTGILGLVDCNFENLSGIPVEASGWHSVRIIGCEFGMWDAFAAGIESIKLSDLQNAEILGCVFNAPFGGDRAITLHNCEGPNVAPMNPGGYNRLTAITGTWEPYTDGNDGFLDLGFVNGWANVPGFQSAQVSLIGGQVVVRMNVQGGTLNSQITTLPLGYRPKASRIFDGGDNAGHCRFIVETNGNVTQYQGTSNLAVSAEFSFWP